MSLLENSDAYLVPAEAASAETKVKGSRFIANIVAVKSKEEAEHALADFRKKYYNATHNCFAWRIDENTFRYSDDGEPSGTAGKPIFQVLEGRALHQALCVVTRYFGGTKLGTGGLIRAYSEAAAEALRHLRLKTLVRAERLELTFTYDLENLVRRTINDFGGTIGESNYSEAIQITAAIPQSKAALFAERLSEKSNALIRIKRD